MTPEHTRIGQRLVNDSRRLAARYVYHVIRNSDDAALSANINDLTAIGWEVYAFAGDAVLMRCDATNSSNDSETNTVVRERAAFLHELADAPRK